MFISAIFCLLSLQWEDREEEWSHLCFPVLSSLSNTLRSPSEIYRHITILISSSSWKCFGHFGICFIWVLKEACILPDIPQITKMLFKKKKKKVKRKCIFLFSYLQSIYFSVWNLSHKRKCCSFSPLSSLRHILLMKKDLGAHVLHQSLLCWFFFFFHLKKTDSHLCLCFIRERMDCKRNKAVVQQLGLRTQSHRGYISGGDLPLFVLMKFLLNEVIIVAVRNSKVGHIDFIPTAISRTCRYRAVNVNCQLRKKQYWQVRGKNSLQPVHKTPAIQITILKQKH